LPGVVIFIIGESKEYPPELGVKLGGVLKNPIDSGDGFFDLYAGLDILSHPVSPEGFPINIGDHSMTRKGVVFCGKWGGFAFCQLSGILYDKLWRLAMMIRVMYPNGKYDMVREDLLDLLVAKRQVKRFRRSSGWIDVEGDAEQLRNDPRYYWLGDDRRTPRIH